MPACRAAAIAPSAAVACKKATVSANVTSRARHPSDWWSA